jgi:hypothetical protein
MEGLTSSLRFMSRCACQRTSRTPGGWPVGLRVDGHECSGLGGVSSPGGWSVQGDHSLAGEGFAQAVAVALGGDEVGVVQQSVDGGGGEGFGHD